MSNRSTLNLVGAAVTGENVGSGSGIFKGKTFINNLQFKSLSGGTGVQLIEGTDTITISAGTGGGGGTPGGANTQVQFNDAGAFGADAGLTYNCTSQDFSAGGTINTSSDFSISGDSFIRAGADIFNSAIEIGKDANSNNSNNVVIGQNACSKNDSGVIIGYGAGSTTGTHGVNATSIGINTNSGTANVGTRSTTVGNGSDTSGNYGVAVGNNLTVQGSSAVAVGNTSQANGTASVALGNIVCATANCSIAIGSNAKSTSLSSTAIGFRAGCTTGIIGACFIAIGHRAGGGASSAADLCNKAIAIGLDSTSSGSDGIAIGSYTSAYGLNSMAIGESSCANNNGVAVGVGNISSGLNAVSVGTLSCATGNCAIAIGRIAKAGDFDAIAIGATTISNCQRTIAIGAQSVSQGLCSIAMGYDACSIGTRSTAIGTKSNANNALNGIAFGSYACVCTGGNNSIAIGDAIAYGQQAVAIGNGSEANASVVVGFGSSRSTCSQGIVIGVTNVNNSQCSVVIGGNSCISGGTGNIAIGHFVNAVDGCTIAIGRGVCNNTANSIGIGWNPSINTPTILFAQNSNSYLDGSSQQLAIGHDSPTAKIDVSGATACSAFRLRDGNETAGYVLTSDASGYATWVVSSGGGGTGATNANNGIVLIGNTVSLGGSLTGDTQIDSSDFGFSLGSGTNTATGANSVAFGDNSSATGTCSMAFGLGARAHGDGSIATGQYGFACAIFSAGIAGGRAYGSRAVTMGMGALGCGAGSAGIGCLSEAHGDFSFAAARGCAHCNYSIAIGIGAESCGACSAVIGGNSGQITGATDAVLLGGDNITVSNATYNYDCHVIVPELAIWTTPSASTCTGVLVYDEVDNKVKLNSSIGGGSGATAANNGLTLSGNIVSLGGTLTGATNICLSTQSLTFQTLNGTNCNEIVFGSGNQPISAYGYNSGTGWQNELLLGPADFTRFGLRSYGGTYDGNIHRFETLGGAGGYSRMMTCDATNTLDTQFWAGMNEAYGRFWDVGGTQSRVYLSSGQTYLNHGGTGGTGTLGLYLNETGATFCDSINTAGLVYNADFSSTSGTNPRWIPDAAWVTGQTGGGAAGTTYDIQFNSAGAFSADTRLKYLPAQNTIIASYLTGAPTGNSSIAIGGTASCPQELHGNYNVLIGRCAKVCGSYNVGVGNFFASAYFGFTNVCGSYNIGLGSRIKGSCNIAINSKLTDNAYACIGNNNISTTSCVIGSHNLGISATVIGSRNLAIGGSYYGSGICGFGNQVTGGECAEVFGGNNMVAAAGGGISKIHGYNNINAGDNSIVNRTGDYATCNSGKTGNIVTSRWHLGYYTQTGSDRSQTVYGRAHQNIVMVSCVCTSNAQNSSVIGNVSTTTEMDYNYLTGEAIRVHSLSNSHINGICVGLQPTGGAYARYIDVMGYNNCVEAIGDGSYHILMRGDNNKVRGYGSSIQMFGYGHCTNTGDSNIMLHGYAIASDGGYNKAVIGTYNSQITGGSSSVFAALDSVSITGGSSFDNHLVAGNLAIWGTPTTGAGTDSVLTWDATSRKVRAVAYANPSDCRLKTCIEDLRGIDLGGFRGVRFEYNDLSPNKGRKAYGVLAQEVEKSFPVIVQNNYVGTDGEKYKTVDYKQLVPILLEKIKELEARIVTLENG